MKIRKMLLSTFAGAAAVAMLATPASAALPDQKCKSDDHGRSWCLFIEKKTSNPSTYRVYVDIDVPMSRADAQAIIDAPGSPFTVKMWGDDSGNNDYLFWVPGKSIQATNAGLYAEFEKIVPRSELNEDDSVGNREDEVFAKIAFTDPRTRVTRTFDSPNFSENF